MSNTASLYGGGGSPATDLEVNTEINAVYFTPPQIPLLPNMPWAGFTFFDDGVVQDTMDFLGTSVINSVAVPGAIWRIDFLFNTSLNNTNYTINMSNIYMKRSISPVVINKTISGFSCYLRNTLGSTSVLVFPEGQI